MTRLAQFEAIGVRVRELRAKAGLSRLQLAARAGLSLMTVHQAERFGIASQRSVSLLAAALGVSPAALTADTPERT